MALGRGANQNAEPFANSVMDCTQHRALVAPGDELAIPAALDSQHIGYFL